MFGFFEDLKLGRAIISEGRTWISILVLPNGYHLAVLPTKQPPAEVYLIKEDGEKEIQ